VSETMVDWTSFATGFLLGVVAWSFVFAAASLRGGALWRAVRGDWIRDEQDGVVAAGATVGDEAETPGRRWGGPDDYARLRAAEARRAVRDLEKRVRDLELRAGYPDSESVQERAQNLVVRLAVRAEEGGEPRAAADELHELMVYAAKRGWTATVAESTEEE